MKKIRRHLKHSFLPHKGNDHKPHLSRGIGVFFVLVISVGFFGFSYLQVQYLNSNEGFLGAVLPAVLVDLVNEDREKAGSEPLQVNQVLQQAAQMKADHMAENGYFAHVSPDGTTPWYWIEEAGYEFVTAGENLAVHFTDSREVEQAWMDSPTHRANIINHSFSEIGIAVARGSYDGYETTFVVQMFGKPASESTAFTEDTRENTQVVEVGSASEPTQETFASIERSPVAVAGAVADDTHMGSEDDIVSQVPRIQESMRYANFWEHLVSEPLFILQAVYFALALLLLITIILMIASEARHKHPRHVVYLVFSLLVIFTLFYAFKPFMFPETLVAYF